MNVVASVKETNRILEKYNLKAKQSLGQNFLIDSKIIQKIIKESNITKNTTVIEIGPGIGGLTQFLSSASKKVYAFEIDQRLQPVLEETLKDNNNVELIFKDFLLINLDEFLNDIEGEIIVVSNLPYYITSTIIEKVVINKKISKMVMMIQKEVAEKLSNPKNTKEISPLHLIMETLGTVNYLFTITNNVFYPKPKVDSAIIEYKQIYKNIDGRNFLVFLHHCFKQRRKTLYNNLKAAYPNKEIKQILNHLHIDSTIRSEALNEETFLKLYQYFAVEDG